ncbi:MAG: hypothetical protein CMN30_31830 [Sandaracinus sp.]|nr:hypothetical protein [Sandaracinus sp.]
MTSNIKGHIYGLIDEIAAAEKITRKKLSILSRDILLYVMESHDIDSVNRLLGVLTPMNKRAAILYFGHFLPWTQEKDKQDVFQRFGKMVKGERKVKAKADAITEWLSDPENNIWLWVEDNVKVDKKKDFAAGVKRAIKQALEGDEKTESEPLTPSQILEAVFESGIGLEDMLLACMEREEKMKESEAKLNAA